MLLYQLIVFASMALFVRAQRSPYVPRPVDYPGVLPRFQTNAQPEDSGLSQRFGTSSSSLPGSLYDDAMVRIVENWPKEKQPFWYINNQYIAAHRGLQQSGRSFQQTDPTGQPEENTTNDQVTAERQGRLRRPGSNNI